MSSVRIATLKPWPAGPSRRDAGMRQAVEGKPRQRVRRDHLDALGDRQIPGVPASTMKAEMPRLPGASPVRANTT